ncbi:hypothetical protein [Amnibacterium kyonggiense]|uniref:Uncharacterized protein n=1 Tax=Amnibacterium kyonggiense TaxID=595671 RepID=A0A4R7FKQ5_9MICO|nr:hypothetical protein [Amnibacterium kyonggiense]TDS76950.1 hypothetical protein CLV52_1889 [Amnibacterium kyonggiense]
MDSSRSHDPRRAPAANWAASYPYATDAPPRTTGPRQASIPQPTPVGQQATYPYAQRQQPRFEPPPVLRAPEQRPTGRRLLGVLAFFVLTGLSLPLHVAAIFFIYVEFESPGDPTTAALLIGGAFLGSFVALLVTGIVSQLVGKFPGVWRARITFAALSGIIALAVAYVGASRLF